MAKQKKPDHRTQIAKWQKESEILSINSWKNTIFRLLKISRMP